MISTFPLKSSPYLYWSLVPTGGVWTLRQAWYPQKLEIPKRIRARHILVPLTNKSLVFDFFIFKWDSDSGQSIIILESEQNRYRLLTVMLHYFSSTQKHSSLETDWYCYHICNHISSWWFFLTLTRISEEMSCVESVIFFANLAYVPHIIQKHSAFPPIAAEIYQISPCF